MQLLKCKTCGGVDEIIISDNNPKLAYPSNLEDPRNKQQFLAYLERNKEKLCTCKPAEEIIFNVIPFTESKPNKKVTWRPG